MVNLKERSIIVEKQWETGSPVLQTGKPQVDVFHCVRALPDTALLSTESADIKGVKMACSAMLREIYLLKAFEAGADAVVVLTCPEGECHHIEGNLRARKRVERVKKLLDAIGLGSERLFLVNMAHGDTAAADHGVSEVTAKLDQKELSGVAS